MKIDNGNEHHRLIWFVLRKISDSIPINLEGDLCDKEFDYYIDVNVYAQGLDNAVYQNRILDILMKERVIVETGEEKDDVLIKDTNSPTKDKAFVVYHLKTTNKFKDFFNEFNNAFIKSGKNGENLYRNKIECKITEGVLTLKFVTKDNVVHQGVFKEGQRTFELLVYLINKQLNTIDAKPIKKKLKTKEISIYAPLSWGGFSNLQSILKSTVSDIRKELGISLAKKMSKNDPAKKGDIVIMNGWNIDLNAKVVMV